MKKLEKKQIKQEVFDLYDAYAHNVIERREFLEKLSFYAVGGITVPAMLNFLMPDYLSTSSISSHDPRLISEYIEYQSPKGGGKMKGLLSMPAGDKKTNNPTNKLGGIVVVHENRGLNPYIEDTARRAALEGFVVLAPDALSPLGGYPGNDDDGRALQRKRDRSEMLEDFVAAYEYLQSHPGVNQNIGVVGFCFGGWISNMMAVRIANLAASVPFYGGQPPLDEVPDINAPLMLHFAGLDTRVNKGWPEYEAMLKKHNKDYIAYIYRDVNHGFHNNTTPRYDEEAANLAWKRTMKFFQEKLN